MRRPPFLPLLLVLVLAACTTPRRAPRRAPPAARDGARDARVPEPQPVPPRADSLRPLSEIAALLSPIARIGDDRIDESSGLAYAGGSWWTVNDSGGGPFLFRAETPWFDAAERLEVRGAKNVDWEDLAVLDGDLLVCDIGDNKREREDAVFYRVRPSAEGIELVATYPVAYPDGPHDAEGVWVWEGRVHVAIKNRGEGTTTVYRWDELRDAADLPDGERNLPEVVGEILLRPGEQVTAADIDADGQLALLTYGQLLIYDMALLEAGPVAEFQLHARQCEALAWTGTGVVFTNEQRDVYRVDWPLESGFVWWMPPRASMPLKIVPRTSQAVMASLPPLELLQAMPLQNRRLGEHVGVGISGDLLVIDGRFLVEGNLVPAKDGRLGTSVLIGIGTEPRTRVTPAERQLAVVATDRGAVRVVPFDMSGGDAPGSLAGVSYGGRATPNEFVFHVAIRTDTVFPDGVPDSFLLAIFGNGMRKGDDEPYFSGLDAFSLLRPYAWGVIGR